jgi:hypothetical protein
MVSFSSAAVIGLGGISLHEDLLDPGHLDRYGSLSARYAIERLGRLGRSAHRNRFILKGAMLFGLWANVPYRATGDLDLLAFGATDATAVPALFRSICTSGTEDDGVQFIADTLRAEQARAEDEYQGLRLTVVAMIAGARLPVQVDIGFGDVITPAAREIDFPAAQPQLSCNSDRAPGRGPLRRRAVI